MIDPKILKENPTLLREICRKRGEDPKLIDRLLKIGQQRRQLIQQAEKIKASQNLLSRAISGSPSPAQAKEGKALKNLLAKVEPDLKAIQKEFNFLFSVIPNIPAPDVPDGKDDSENVQVKKWGKPPKFNFKPKDHLALGEALDILDVKRAAKVSGTRQGYFKGRGAQLEMSLMFFVFSKLVKKGFIAIIPPVIFKEQMEWGMGYQKSIDPKTWNEMYHFPKDGQVLASSSEHTVIPMHAGEIINASDLPLRYVNFSTCFRRESGSYGRDTHGMFRVHQFNKVEMNVFTIPDEKISDQACLDLLAVQEEIVQELKLPYRIVNACTGDLPRPNRRMWDLEVWFPSQNRYRETHSCSNCSDYQTRRLNIRTQKAGRLVPVHALNATAVTDRLLLAFMENYQQKDGSIKIPPPLQKITGLKKIP